MANKFTPWISMNVGETVEPFTHSYMSPSASTIHQQALAYPKTSSTNLCRTSSMCKFVYVKDEIDGQQLIEDAAANLAEDDPATDGDQFWCLLCPSQPNSSGKDGHAVHIRREHLGHDFDVLANFCYLFFRASISQVLEDQCGRPRHASQISRLELRIAAEIWHYFKEMGAIFKWLQLHPPQYPSGQEELEEDTFFVMTDEALQTEVMKMILPAFKIYFPDMEPWDYGQLPAELDQPPLALTPCLLVHQSDFKKAAYPQRGLDHHGTIGIPSFGDGTQG